MSGFFVQADRPFSEMRDDPEPTPESSNCFRKITLWWHDLLNGDFGCSSVPMTAGFFAPSCTESPGKSATAGAQRRQTKSITDRRYIDNIASGGDLCPQFKVVGFDQRDKLDGLFLSNAVGDSKPVEPWVWVSMLPSGIVRVCKLPSAR